MPTKVNWHVARYRKALEGQMSGRLDRAARMLKREIVENISTGFPPASTAGQPPHVRTGDLRRSINEDAPGPMVRRIGSTLKPVRNQLSSYALYLERGTKRMAARPYLIPALMRMRKTIRDVLAGKLVAKGA